MTVEKAIEILSDVGDINRCCAEDAEALDKAIKALEQQQSRCDSCIHSEEQDGSNCYECVKGMADNFEAQSCEDCISREAVDEYITNLLSGYLYDEERTRLEDLTAYIWELPSVTPKAEQKAILDKIKAEIEQLTSRYSISKERGGMGIVEWSDRLIKESDVLQIIDKYKAKGEKECR